MASGPALYVVRVEHRVSSLQLLCQQTIASSLRDDKDISKLTLPPRLCSYLTTAFTPTIKVKDVFEGNKWKSGCLILMKYIESEKYKAVSRSFEVIFRVLISTLKDDPE